MKKASKSQKNKLQKKQPSNHPFFKRSITDSTIPSSNPTVAHAAILQKTQMLWEQKRWDEAEKTLNDYLLAHPKNTQALNLKAIVLAGQYRTLEAQQVWLQVIALDSTDISAYTNLGRLYQMNKQYPEAEKMLLKAITLNKTHFDALLNLGVTYHSQGKRTEALACYDTCLKLSPKSTDAWFNKGRALQDEFDYASAFDCYRQVLSINPTHYGANANLIMTQFYVTPYNAEKARDEAFRFGRVITQDIHGMTAWTQNRDPNRQLNIGFVSADLRQHPVGYFLQDIFLAMDDENIHENVQLFAYSNSPIVDDLTQKIYPKFKAWRNIDILSDDQAVSQILNDKIDILIDLSGHTAGNRLSLFAHKPAPIQVTWLGYFATTGLSCIDYIMADAFSLPQQDEHLYIEKPYRLPNSRLFLFKPNTQPTPRQNGQKNQQNNQSFTFGCFQELHKINDEVLTTWAEILEACPHAYLRIQSGRLDHTIEQQRFTERLKLHGFDLNRIQLFGHMSRKDYFNAYNNVDIILDTFPFPGGTTTVEALWMGVPTLTLSSQGLLGHQGEGLLQTVGLTDWVCTDIETYKQRAISSAQQDYETISKIKHLHQTLPKLCEQSKAANASLFAHNLVNAWRDMWKQYSISKHK